jgi:hypothetical protein
MVSSPEATNRAAPTRLQVGGAFSSLLHPSMPKGNGRQFATERCKAPRVNSGPLGESCMTTLRAPSGENSGRLTHVREGADIEHYLRQRGVAEVP